MSDISIQNEVLHKEIDLVQACITRMSNNSFMCKGWFVSLAAVVLALMLDNEINLLHIGIFLLLETITFWGLDGFFLKMEKLYCWKYKWIIIQRPQGNNHKLYDLDPYSKDMRLNPNEDDHLYKFLFSKTLLPFYGIPIVISLIILGTQVLK